MRLKSLAIAAGLWIVLGAFLVPVFVPLLNADGTSYVSLAEKYCRGDWANAINGYWGPLLSWLMVPLLALKIDPFIAARIVLLMAGLLLLWAVRRLSAALDLEEPLSSILLFACLPIGLYMVFTMITPDFLVTSILLSYLAVFLGDGFPRRWTSGAVCGVLGALAYFAKPYAFLFFLIHFSGAIVIRCLARKTAPERRRLASAGAAGLAAFALLSGAWIGLISYKYHHVLINSAGRYNLAYLRPGSPGQPIRTEGFLPPPNATAFSAWEDPDLIPLPDWNPTRSSLDRAYYIGLLGRNAVEFIKSLDDFSLLGPLIFILGCVSAAIAVFRRPASRRNRRLAWLVGTMTLYSFGYALLLVEDRYLWFDDFLMAIIALSLLTLFLSRNPAQRWKSAAAGLAVLSTFLVLPACFFPAYSTASASETLIPATEIHDLASHLKIHYGLRGRFASNRYWNESLAIAAFDHLQYFGSMRPEWTGAELEAAFKKYALRYFFLWRHGDPKFDFLSDYITVVHYDEIDLTVYLLKKRPAAQLYATIRDREIPLETILWPGVVPPPTDDRPINEYFLLRRTELER